MIILKSISIVSLLFVISCTSDSMDCGSKTVSGVRKSLNRGPEGGCYYINSNGNKSYVDRSECSC